jgi:hypothetical protein
MDAMADGLSLEADQAGFTDFFRAEYETSSEPCIC